MLLETVHAGPGLLLDADSIGLGGGPVIGAGK